MTQSQILDYEQRLPEFRRNADQRYYKGTEYANILESLARRRTAELFASNGFWARTILYVNVQPLSGAPANNAVYSALLNAGDTVLGMDLIMGGHLTHGSPVNRSGINYNIVSYTIDPESERLDYDQIRDLAHEHKPRLIIGGYSSYPFAADWKKYRSIADEVGAYLLGRRRPRRRLDRGGHIPQPGWHRRCRQLYDAQDAQRTARRSPHHPPPKSVAQARPRGISGRAGRTSHQYDGRVGGRTTHRQHRTIPAVAAADAHVTRCAWPPGSNRAALRLPYGGTDTHLLLVDCKSITGRDGAVLSGDMAARILDLAGIVVNRQTIPGDTSALRPSGIRLGTTWVSQRGMVEAEVDTLGDIIADVLQACAPFPSRRPRQTAAARQGRL